MQPVRVEVAVVVGMQFRVCPKKKTISFLGKFQHCKIEALRRLQIQMPASWDQELWMAQKKYKLKLFRCLDNEDERLNPLERVNCMSSCNISGAVLHTTAPAAPTTTPSAMHHDDYDEFR